MSEVQQTSNYLEFAAEIVSAFVSNNSLPATELPALIGSVHAALSTLDRRVLSLHRWPTFLTDKDPRGG